MVSENDRRVLELVCGLRVVSNRQLERLCPDLPPRTLRYRTRRLHGLGLLGRSRPYRDRGSAPWHLWPTRRADALIRGQPEPRGGERRPPNPLFLAHATAVSELYVTLHTASPAEFVLDGFWREAREEFRARSGRDSSICPDATVTLRDGDRRLLAGLVEVDLGTMSHARLRAKARAYAEYVMQAAWRARRDWCPAVLFATTSRQRANAFCRHLDAELTRGRARYFDAEAVCVACDRVYDLTAAVSAPCWYRTGNEQGLTLVDCLREARRPYDERLAHELARERRDDAHRARLRADPEALREHLRGRLTGPFYLLCERLGEPGARSLDLLLGGNGPLEPAERAALDALAGEDPLDTRIGETPTATVGDALDLLAERYRQRQRAQARKLAGRYGDGPALRNALAQLDGGRLLSAAATQELERRAASDRRAAVLQTQRREAYAERRPREARRLARHAGLAARLLSAGAYLEDADRRWLRVCPACQETVYPEPDEQDLDGSLTVARSCPFCASSHLEPWPEGLEPASGPSPHEQAYW